MRNNHSSSNAPTGMDGGGVIVMIVMAIVFLAGFGLGAWVF